MSNPNMPSFGVYYPLHPMPRPTGEEQPIGEILTDHLIQDHDVDVAPAQLERLFRAARAPKAFLLSAEEVSEFHTAVGRTPSRKTVIDMRNHVVEAVEQNTADLSDIIPVRGFKVRDPIRKRNSVARLTAEVPENGFTHKRATAIGALATYYGLDPNRTWLRTAHHAVSMPVASGKQVWQKRCMNAVKQGYEAHDFRLPLFSVGTIDTSIFK